MDHTQQHDTPWPPAEPGINGWNAVWIEDLRQRWQQDPKAVPDSWQHFFAGFALGDSTSDADGETHGQRSVDALIDAHRRWGHLAANIDPLGQRARDLGTLELEAWGLSQADLDRRFDPGTLPLPPNTMLREIIRTLRECWCGSIGIESEHLSCPTRRAWWRERVESPEHVATPSDETRHRVLHDLQRATGLERFLMKRYVGSKWFSLEGGEALIPMLVTMLDEAAHEGVQEVAFGMAHRGRVNVLVNILEKSYDQLFTEFEESWTEDFLESGGDVKYHRGFSADIKTPSGDSIHVSMASNPSHLEWGHPVVLGRVRAKQRLRGDTRRSQCLPILIHGDAALPGQGIVQELANMAGLSSYDVGGSIHLVINNQIGFTADHEECFSGTYCTDVLRAHGVPILHVNGLDPDQCLRAMELAVQWRQQFGTDVAIDLWGWRRYGHNETDEPSFTNPILYQHVANATSVVESYAQRMAEDGLIDTASKEAADQRLLEVMSEAQDRVRATPVRPTPPAFDDHSTWAGFSTHWHDDPIETCVPREVLSQIADAFGKIPTGFKPHRKLERLLQERASSIREDAPLDWAMGELFAYGSLLLDGYPIRLTGEDCQRGTFSHRHAVLRDAHTGDVWSPLDHIDTGQSRMCVHNSPVTESGCIGFEYGYSLGDPNMLVIWEAQFGDFANVGQVYFDQFIASAERKWRRNSGMVCLLPHGYEGMGPEHSSARVERFLQLCADENMEVVIPTTPAQMFHLLRRQMRRPFRKPLIVMTPKSLLRHKSAVSRVNELCHGQFEAVLPDPEISPASADRILLCSGKIGWDLMAARHEAGSQACVIRIEQLYPFPEDRIRTLLNDIPNNIPLIWVQEEPRNAGGWTFMSDVFLERFDRHITFIGRPANASPAVGSARLHRAEQARLLASAIGTSDPSATHQEQQA